MSGRIDVTEDDASLVYGSDEPTPNFVNGIDGKGIKTTPDILLEGWLLKRNRNNYWQDRYFIFQSDQTLFYWHKQSKKDRNNSNSTNPANDAVFDKKNATATFKVSRQAGCEISDLYVEKRSSSSLSTSIPSVSPSSGKVSLYCIDISWTQDAETEISLPPKHLSSPSPDDGLYLQQTEDDHQNNNWEESSVNSSNSVRRRRPSFLRRRKSKRGKSSAEMVHDMDEKMFENYSSNAQWSSDAMPSPTRSRSLGPLLSESQLDARNNSNKSFEGNFIGKTKSEDKETGGSLEQEKLHNQFVTKQRKRRSVKAKRMVDATKVAVAAGAAVGAGVMTAGVGIAAGLFFLGGAAAIGGTAGVAEAGLKRTLKKKDDLTIATTDYAVARIWKAKLDACLEQEYLKQSTWAQRFAEHGGKTARALIPDNVFTLKSQSEDETDGIRGQLSAASNHLDASKQRSNSFLRDSNILAQDTTKWKPLDGETGIGSQSLRIFKEEKNRDDELSMKVSQSNEGDDSSCTPLKTQLVLNAHPAEAFMCIMSYARIPPSSFYSDNKNGVKENALPLSPNSGQVASFRLLETIDDHRDVLHLVCRPTYIFPSLTVARDFVLVRYWRYEPDGSYVICYESTEYANCPPQPGFVRGTLHQVYTIAPPKNNVYRRKSPYTNECMLTAVVQVNPKGWIPTRQIICQSSNQTYADSFGVSTLLQTLDIRDAIENDRFCDLSPDLLQYPVNQPSNLEKRTGMITDRSVEGQAAFDLRFVDRERCDSFTTEKFPFIGHNPAPLGSERWAEPDPNSFLVRGPNYLADGVKINAGSSIGKLIAMDCVAVDKPIITGLSLHPTERIQLALKREKEMKEKGLQCDTPPFIFAVNIIVPATQCFHAVFYYAVDDMSTIDGTDGTPSSRLCQKFIFGDSDVFRDETFKLIPRIVEGNFLVRKAVGSTPAIMGTRLKQYYVRNERFMEIVLDCGSSQVAEGVIKLSLGYAKTLVVDMGFLLEAREDEHLPERIFGGVRVKYPSFGNELRKVKPPLES
mmetsp:Transcript_3770/g.9884  ORF Transcript_3770/g.9884 Transcript_3770/m.9884 type:complete len:1027 (-) Transcript_3770:1839-4919(-)